MPACRRRSRDRPAALHRRRLAGDRRHQRLRHGHRQTGRAAGGPRRRPPGPLENYLQEAGRAGRDRAAARCVLLYTPEDVERAVRPLRALPAYPARDPRHPEGVAPPRPQEARGRARSPAHRVRGRCRVRGRAAATRSAWRAKSSPPPAVDNAQVSISRKRKREHGNGDAADRRSNRLRFARFTSSECFRLVPSTPRSTPIPHSPHAHPALHCAPRGTEGDAGRERRLIGKVPMTPRGHARPGVCAPRTRLAPDHAPAEHHWHRR